ncbi:hypothetical protein CHUAL_002047 [Chamberlinius hualienensis]
MFLNQQIANVLRLFNRKPLRKNVIFMCAVALICYGVVDLLRYSTTNSDFYLFDDNQQLTPEKFINSTNNGKDCQKIILNDFLKLSKLPPKEDEAIQFIPHLRNPCWYEEYRQEDVDSIIANPYQYTVHGKNYSQKFHKNIVEIHNIYKERLDNGIPTRLRCLPYVYIIGQPKCGTTDLFKKLSFHPQVRRGLLKETHWWKWSITGVYSLWNFYEIEFPDLVDLYSFASIKIENMTKTHCKSQLTNTCNEPIILDGSAFAMNWVHSNVTASIHKGYDLETPLSVPSYIKWTTPNAKFIVVLRNPVSRLYSGYKYFPTYRPQFNKNPNDFHQLTVEAISNFSKCMETEGHLFNCSFQPNIINKEMTISHGMYAPFLEEWFKIFKKENFLVLQMEDYKQNMKKTLKTIYKFLDLCNLADEEEDKIVNTKVFNAGKLKIPPMLEETKKLLHEFYKPFNERLAYIMNDTRFLWE